MNKEDEIQLLTEQIDAAQPQHSPTALAELYFRRGKALWGMGERTRAMNDYARAVDLDPESPAAQALEMARSIMAFFNPDQFNP